MHRIITRSRSTAGVEGDERVCRVGIGYQASGLGVSGAGRVMGGRPTAERDSGQSTGCIQCLLACRTGTKKPANALAYPSISVGYVL